MISELYMPRLSSRMKRLGTAIFSDFSDVILKFPTSVIRVLSVNESNEIWFLMPKPYADISGMEKRFPAVLHFYNKDCNFYINAEGIADIISKFKHYPNDLIQHITGSEKESLVIRVRISHAEYFHRVKNKKRNFYQTIVNTLKFLFVNPQRVYSLNSHLD